VHLKGLTKLKTLYLNGDTELAHLKGLTKLTNLEFDVTRVTDAGVAELKKALPRCRISR